jgi:hypothetical protein
MSILQNFEKFLETKHIIPKKRISFYLGWVTQCLAFLDKAETDDISPEDMLSLPKARNIDNNPQII